MQKKNSCDGITFYYRPEDYEDTISDEDVADLLDDIELAGIDDATGEVVCTLEEDSDNSDLHGSGIQQGHNGSPDRFFSG